MNFGIAQSGMLAGLAMLLIPFIIHLLFRQKPRDMKLGSIRFLSEIMEKHRSRRKVMRWLLMSLRMACIALVALMFARPYFTELTPTSGADGLIVILIDQSASMQLHSDGVGLIDEAVKQARKIVQGASENTRIEVAFFDHEIHPLQTTAGSNLPVSELLGSLEVPKQSYSATDYAAAFRWAYDICATSKTNNRRLHVFTDLQQSGLAWSETEPMSADVKVEVHDLGRDLPTNVAIINSSPARMVVRPGESTSIEVSLLNSGAFSMEEVPVILDIKNGTRTIHKREKVKLEPGSIERVRFDLPKLGQGLWQGSASVELIDDLAFDNLRHVGIMAATKYRVLIVDGDPNDINFLSETHYLESALRLAPKDKTYQDSPYIPVVDSLSTPLDDFDVVVLANVSNVDVTDSQRLKKFVDAGGGVIVFAGDQVEAKGYQELDEAGLVPVEIAAVRNATDLPWRIGQWDKTHSIFEPFDDPQHGNLQQLAFRGIVEFNPKQGANVAARFNDQSPFVVEQSVGDNSGGVIWVANSCDGMWSNWTQSELYLPIMHQLLGHLTGLNQGGHLQEALIDTASSKPVSTTPGIFRNGKSWQVVNVSPRESETERCSAEDFATRFGLNTGAQQQVATQRRSSLSSAMDVRENEFWHWILFALVSLGTLEFFLANRTSA